MDAANGATDRQTAGHARVEEKVKVKIREKVRTKAKRTKRVRAVLTHFRRQEDIRAKGKVRTKVKE